MTGAGEDGAGGGGGKGGIVRCCWERRSIRPLGRQRGVSSERSEHSCRRETRAPPRECAGGTSDTSRAQTEGCTVTLLLDEKLNSWKQGAEHRREEGDAGKGRGLGGKKTRARGRDVPPVRRWQHRCAAGVGGERRTAGSSSKRGAGLSGEGAGLSSEGRAEQ